VAFGGGAAVGRAGGRRYQPSAGDQQGAEVEEGEALQGAQEQPTQHEIEEMPTAR
jgi:hypothetical protein